MARRRKTIVFENVEISDVASGGKSIAKIDDKVVFVTGAVPGDVVDLRVVKKKKSFMEAIPTAYHKYSEDRVEPFCEHFGLCGGCKWQQLPYEKQLEYKQKEVVDHLTRIGKVELPEVTPILGSPEITYYRNKMEFAYTDTRWLLEEEKDLDIKETRGCGFHIPGKFDKIVHLNHCHLQGNISNDVRSAMMDFIKENDLTCYNARKQEGLMRSLMIRTASTGDVMVLVQFHKEETEIITTTMEFLKEKFPQITSLMYVVNGKGNDTIYDLDVVCYHGVPYITEEMEGLKFRVGPKSFYQTNSAQAYELYKITRDFAGLTGNERVYDLYTGTGTIAQFVSRKAKEVVGIESVPAAIEDAKKNAELNGITNCKFYAGDMKDLLTKKFIDAHGIPDVIITDPPRVGMHQDVVNQLLEVAAKRIVYVSCNSATQARDLELLDAKYKVIKVQPVDQFPHTWHIENVVLLELK
ncbi:23S rRNA (uracil(1939)-C(5))-methyltransferase RlmD [Sediminitomix flava]|uniref:23S rRNA (Uracil1939-C5)-methyltransferase n=1 Tax=Sediminitomix flava TaxID=379075 RepID=A0A315Z5E3_SEDFL|nr:23S rRNA (uracil(1939)-C(5))-methyltransferase RlmD [Sediminitomix flava]PWJ38487.1 23S rRNA (uracil1939-C5)-methyltransferase [Sediminitomix flava]